MANPLENAAATRKMTTAELEAFAAKSNAVRDTGNWTSKRWRVTATGLEEYETRWQAPWRPTPAEKDAVKAEAIAFAARYPWLTVAQYAELVDRYGNNIPDHFEVAPPPLRKRVFLRHAEFERIVDERGAALSYMMDIGAIYRSREGHTVHPACRAQPQDALTAQEHG